MKMKKYQCFNYLKNDLPTYFIVPTKLLFLRFSFIIPPYSTYIISLLFNDCIISQSFIINTSLLI